MEIIPFERKCLMVLCLWCIYLYLLLYILLCAFLIVNWLSQWTQIVDTGFG
jgi:hypothetical protein